MPEKVLKSVVRKFYSSGSRELQDFFDSNRKRQFVILKMRSEISYFSDGNSRFLHLLEPCALNLGLYLVPCILCLHLR